MLFNRKNSKHIESLGIASVMGLQLVSGVVVGLAMGYYLDKYFETKPWLTLIFLVFGIIAGYRNMFREMQRIQKKEADADARNDSKKIERALYAWGFHVPEVRKMALHQVYILLGVLLAPVFGWKGVDLATGVLLGTLNFLALAKLIQELVYLQKSAVVVQIFSFYGRLLITALAFYVLIAHLGSSGAWLLMGFSTVLINILLWGMSQFLGKTSKEA